MKDNSYYLEALINRDSRKIKKLYEECFPKVERFLLMNKGTSYDAEDIFQKALLQITVRYQKERFVIKSSFEGYLFTVCRNLWRRELNANKKWVTDNEVIALNEEEFDLATALVEQKRWELFAEALEVISENCKKVLKMFFNRIPYARMVEELGYNSETVARQRVFKCKAKLTQLIKKDKRYESLKEL
ncbi:RNA polymerase sigma factor [Aquimarina rhabdastrellae]